MCWQIWCKYDDIRFDVNIMMEETQCDGKFDVNMMMIADSI